MKKAIIVTLIIGLLPVIGAPAFAAYKKFDIKYGMHWSVVNQKYGDPIESKVIRTNPIPVKKGLYKVDEATFAALHFFSGRIYKIVLLQDMDAGEALSIFREE